jgi:hypothetical protein
MRILLSVIVVLSLSNPLTVDANPVCRWIGFCVYLSPGFVLTVVDTETGKPLPEVYGWAEWTQYGAHGRGGPLMVQDATSGADGRLTFPRWGPSLGSAGGVLLGFDPSVILFKPGYATLLIQNSVPPGADHHAVVRGMSRNGDTLRLQPFRGSPVQWVEQLQQLVFPALSYGSEADGRRFRDLYLRRLEHVESQLTQLPSHVPEVASLRSSLELERRHFAGGRR